MRSTKSVILPLIGVILLTLLCFVAALVFGSVTLPLSAIWEGSDAVSQDIFWLSRTPHALAALLVGASLAVSGNLMQVIFRNPLAGPSVLGISGGASLAVAVVVLSTFSFLPKQFSHSAVFVAALLGSSVVLFLLLILQRRVHYGATLLIVGLLLSHFTGALETVLQKLADGQRLSQYVFWGMGSLDQIRLDDTLGLMALAVLPLIPSYFFTSSLNAYALGDEVAITSGYSVKQLRFYILTMVGISVAGITAYCGPIAFVGLMAPHAVRMVFATSNQKQVMLLVPFFGAIVLLLADMLSRVFVLPLNALTALVSIPFLIYVLMFPKKSGLWIN